MLGLSNAKTKPNNLIKLIVIRWLVYLKFP